MDKKLLPVAASLIPGLLIAGLRPLGLTSFQAIVLAAIVTVILWWIVKIVDRTVASVILLAVFCLSGQVPLRTVFSFPISENFWLIVFSFLFSQGIANSGLADKLLLPILERWANTSGKVVLSMLLLIAVMVPIIPQPFSRIIIISLIYARFFDRLGLEPDLKASFMFGIYSFSIGINMLFLRGDIILNTALLAIGDVSMGEETWMKYMTVPGLVLVALSALLFAFVFRKELRRFPAAVRPTREKIRLSGREKLWLSFVVLTVVFWALEDVHGLSGTYIVIGASVLMVPLGLLKLPEDLKTVNLKLLVFLTAAFSIGGTLKACGAAAVLFAPFASLLPDHFSPLYAMIVVLSSMALHMLLGSNITTLSVVVPALMSLSVVPQQEVLLLLIYIAVCGHFLLPFHSVLLLLGEGNDYFSSKVTLSYGVPATGLILLAVPTVFLGWWAMMGLL